MSRLRRLVNWNEAEGGVMFDPIYEALLDLFEEPDEIGPGNFEQRLAEYGLMIVPIDDPAGFLSPRDEDD